MKISKSEELASYASKQISRLTPDAVIFLRMEREIILLVFVISSKSPGTFEKSPVDTGK